ncbi:MAG: response regulator [Rickettsiales bacterium]
MKLNRAIQYLKLVLSFRLNDHAVIALSLKPFHSERIKIMVSPQPHISLIKEHPMRILLVEDDTMIGESLTHALRSSGYSVDWAKDGDAGELSLQSSNYNLVLLDVSLPKRSGLEILASLRQRKETVPVLILTARDSVTDRVQGLDGGADDYLVKPFALEEVEARIRVLLRRHLGQAEPILQSANIILNLLTKEIEVGDKKIILSAREYALMYALMERPGKVLSRAELEEKLYGWNEEVSSNAVEVHIHGLRKKLGNAIIRNIRGMGYMVSKA